MKSLGLCTVDVVSGLVKEHCAQILIRLFNKIPSNEIVSVICDQIPDGNIHKDLHES